MKKLVLGLLTAAISMAPAFAAGHSSVAGVNGHVLGTPVTCDDDEFISGGAFCQWVPAHNHSVSANGYIFEMGATGDPDTTVGLRVNATNLPFRSGQLDWNLTNADEPTFLFFFNDRTNGIDSIYIDPFDLSSGDGITVTNLKNGYTRFVFNSAGLGVPSTYRLNTLYMADYLGYQDGTEDDITNIYLNGAAVVPDLHSGTNPPPTDCSISFGGGG